MLEALLLRFAPNLPPPLRRVASPGRIALLAQFMMFGTVGLFGLTLDTATVYALRGRLGLYGAGLAAYMVGASGTWLLNRSWTFRGKGGGPAHRQWARFLIANSFGFVLNRGTYALLVTFVPLAAMQPVIATSAGAVAGMFINFNLSRRMVFR
jgi:putative flippase GtrA